MLISLPSIFTRSDRCGSHDHHHQSPTHESMLWEHEKRKGEELNRQQTHKKRFLAWHNL